jgi:hypothetical protein
MRETSFPSGPFPGVTFFQGVFAVASFEGGGLTVRTFGADLVPRDVVLVDPLVGSEGFPRIAGGWVAYKDQDLDAAGHQWAHAILRPWRDDGYPNQDLMDFGPAPGNFPVAMDQVDGRIVAVQAWDQSRPVPGSNPVTYGWYYIRVYDRMQQRFLPEMMRDGAPTGISRVIPGYKAFTVDEDRWAMPGGTTPFWTGGGLSVCEGPHGGVLCRLLNGKELLLWPWTARYAPVAQWDGTGWLVVSDAYTETGLPCHLAYVTEADFAMPVVEQPLPVHVDPIGRPLELGYYKAAGRYRDSAHPDGDYVTEALEGAATCIFISATQNEFDVAGGQDPVALTTKAIREAVAAGKHVLLDGNETTIQCAAPYWDAVAGIIVSAEAEAGVTDWESNVARCEQHARDVRAWIATYGRSPRLIAAYFDGDITVGPGWRMPQGCDAVVLNGYIGPASPETIPDAQLILRNRLARQLALVPPGVRVALAAQAYDRNGAWGAAKVATTLAALQPVYADVARSMASVIWLLWFAYSRPGGTLTYASALRPWHQAIYQAMGGTPPAIVIPEGDVQTPAVTVRSFSDTQIVVDDLPNHTHIVIDLIPTGVPHERDVHVAISNPAGANRSGLTRKIVVP